MRREAVATEEETEPKMEEMAGHGTAQAQTSAKHLVQSQDRNKTQGMENIPLG